MPKPITTCEECGADLSSPASIERHRGTSCYIKHLERRLATVEAQSLALIKRVKVLEERQSITGKSLQNLLIRNMGE